MAKDTHCHCVAISSLSNEGNLRGSGALGYHADNVFLLDEKNQKRTLKIDKARNGPKDSFDLAFRGDLTLFTDPETRHNADDYPEARKYGPD